jgi:hypothetical protein
LIAILQGLPKLLDLLLQIRESDFAKHVALVTQIFLRVPQQQFAVFDVTRCKHVDLIGVIVGQALRLPI